MPVKKSYKKTRRQRKTRRQQQTRRQQKTRRHKSIRHNKKQKGGNYQTDVTTRTTMGEATKPLRNIVATRPGYPAMSGESLFRMQEEIDRNGDDTYT